MKSIIVSFILSLFALQVNAQTDYEDEYYMDSIAVSKRVDLHTQYSYFGGHLLEIGLFLNSLAYYTEIPVPTITHGPSLSLAIANKNKNNFMGLKLAYEANVVFVTGRINGYMFTNFQKNAYYLSPELGATTFGLIQLTYSHNFPIRNHLNFNPKHQVNLAYSIPLKKLSHIEFTMLR